MLIEKKQLVLVLFGELPYLGHCRLVTLQTIGAFAGWFGFRDGSVQPGWLVNAPGLVERPKNP